MAFAAAGLCQTAAPCPASTSVKAPAPMVTTASKTIQIYCEDTMAQSYKTFYGRNLRIFAIE